MTEIPKCQSCGRRPSERLSGRLIDRREAGRSWVEVSQDNCPDACHDAADLGPAAVALLRECMEPGVFGPWLITEDPGIPHGVELLCKQLGYGAMLHHIAALWEKAHPGAAHSVAACTDVRRKFIARVKALLAAAPEVKP